LRRSTTAGPELKNYRASGLVLRCLAEVADVAPNADKDSKPISIGVRRTAGLIQEGVIRIDAARVAA
jgi:hypothetical protein